MRLRHCFVGSQIRRSNGASRCIAQTVVTVWDGKVIAGAGPALAGKEYYVRDPGAATREAGFHTRLVEFLGWKMPDVLRYDGQAVPLYLECLVPLYYVEQRHGWSAIQATTPRYLQIRDVDKKALEYLLNLDASARDMARQKLEQEITEIKHKWAALRDECERVARGIGGSLRNLAVEPLASWPPEVAPLIEVYSAENPQSLEVAITSDSENLHRLLTEVVPSVAETVTETEAELQGAARRLDEAEQFAEELTQDIELEASELRSFDARLKSLDEDLKKNQDVEKLRKYGASSSLNVTQGKCPTCHQSISDSLLAQQTQEAPMTVPENIEYLRSQIQTFEKMRSRLADSVAVKDRRRIALHERINGIRGEIRSLKRTLISDGRAPSLAAVRDRITLEERITRGRSVQDQFSMLLSGFAELAVQWRALQARKKELTGEVLSSRDLQKIQSLEATFLELEKQFGFNSCPIDRISLSREHFKPTREGFDLVYDVSASDNVRTICAYMIALLEIARKYPTNHPGLLVLDEPRQQNMVWRDLAEVITRTGQAGIHRQQVIVATSDTAEAVAEITRTVECTVVSIEGKILKRLAG